MGARLGPRRVRLRSLSFVLRQVLVRWRTSHPAWVTSIPMRPGPSRQRRHPGAWRRRSLRRRSRHGRCSVTRPVISAGSVPCSCAGCPPARPRNVRVSPAPVVRYRKWKALSAMSIAVHTQTESQTQAQPQTPTHGTRANRETDAQAKALLSLLGDLPAGTDRERVRARLIELYIPLAEYLARRFRNRGEQLDDLMQVANLG